MHPQAASASPPEAVQPGDVLLFGSKGRRSTWKQVDHAGIAMGNGLFIHSSSQGVTITRWDTGWHADSFAWGKDVLGPAGAPAQPAAPPA